MHIGIFQTPCIYELSLLNVLLLTLGVTGRFHDENNVCYSAPCRNGGECIDLTTATGEKKFECACMEGYEGLTCQKRINPCATDPCKNEGQCVPRPGNSYHCICAKGFQGRHCENKKPLDKCESKPCSPNGVCIPTNDAYVCECHSGYSGPKCKHKISPVDEEEANAIVPPPVAPVSPYSALVIALLVIVITLVVILLIVGIHCARVINRLSNLKAAQERRRSAGEDPGLCPGAMETSNQMCIDFFCCRDRKKYLGEVTGVIVPVAEFKSMMKNQESSEYDQITPKPIFYSGDRFLDYNDKNEKSCPGTRQSIKTANNYLNHDQHKKEVSRQSFDSHLSKQQRRGCEMEDDTCYPDNFPNRTHSQLSNYNSTSPRQAKQFTNPSRQGTEGQPHSRHSPNYPIMSGQNSQYQAQTRQATQFQSPTRKETQYPTQQGCGYQTPNSSPANVTMKAGTIPVQIRNMQSLHTKSFGDLSDRYKSGTGNPRGKGAFCPPLNDSPIITNSAPKLLESSFRRFGSPRPQIDNSNKPTILMPAQRSIQAANLEKYQAISRPDLEKRMSKLLQRQSELSNAAAQLSRYSQTPANYFNRSDLNYPSAGQYNKTQSKVPVDNNVFNSPSQINRTPRSRLPAVKPELADCKLFTVQEPASRRKGKTKRSELSTIPLLSTSKRKQCENSKDSNLNNIPSEENTSLDESYFNNNSEFDDISPDNFSPFEFFDEAAVQKMEQHDRKIKGSTNLISKNIRKQRKRSKKEIQDYEPDSNNQLIDLQVDKRKNLYVLKRENKNRRYPKGENKDRREVSSRSDSRKKGSDRRAMINKKHRSKYILLPQSGDSDDDYRRNSDMDEYGTDNEQVQRRHNIFQYNQAAEEDEDNNNDEDSGDEGIERLEIGRTTMDDGYVSTGRMSESDVGGRDRDPLSFEQGLVNQRNQNYHIRPRLNGEEIAVRGINRFNPALSTNTTDDEEQHPRRSFRQTEQKPTAPKRIVHTSYSHENRRQSLNPLQFDSLIGLENERNTNVSKKIGENLEIPGGEKKKIKRGEIPRVYKKPASRMRWKRKEGQVNGVAETTVPRLKGILKKKQNSTPTVTNFSMP